MHLNFPGDLSLEVLEPFIFRVTIRADTHESIGTGFAVGRVHKTGQLVLATARHVLSPPGEGDLTWQVAQFDRNGSPRRAVTFRTKNSDKSLPYRWHKEFDVAVVTLPMNGWKGEPVSKVEGGVRLINPQKGLSAGTRIAWAGYPTNVEDVLGFPQLCYLEGSVSAMVDTDGGSLYMADGHVTHGVSGGPVWHSSEEDGCPEIVGIVSHYAPSDEKLPGFCVFEPINPLFYYLSQWHVSLPGGYDNYVVMNHGV